MVLRADDLTKRYASPDGEVLALDHVSLTLARGEFAAVMGPSGCGKSTLLLAAGGLQAPDSGTVSVADEDLYALGSEARAKFRGRTIGFVFQQFHLVPYLSALDNVLAPTLAHAIPDAQERAIALLAELGIADRKAHVPSRLSVGERQRVALARALLPGPSLILADEPTGNLDRASADVVLDRMGSFADAGGAVLLVTHDETAAARADRIHRMEAGRLVTPEPSST